MQSSLRRLNHYELTALIGEGGMGRVYRATDTRLGREVALKVLPPEVAADEERLGRFRREARALAALNHPNIVTIYSVEECEGTHFLTMELIEGRTLDAIIPPGGLATERFLAIALPLAESVAAAHAVGLTHRDLKPQNVMIGSDGRVKVLDFGLARFTDAPSPDGRPSHAISTMLHTQEGLIVGTLPYLAPEQIDGRTADARSDIYALGVVFYEMATGRRPFVHDSTVALLAAIIRDHPVPVASLAPALPPEVHTAIMRCLEKDPGARFPNAAALGHALRDMSLPPITRELSASLSPSGFRHSAVAIGSVAAARLSGSPLVGRESELSRLLDRLDAAASGHGGLVLLGGEPGVGKTRLSEDVMREGNARRFLALAGHCHESGTTPYGPFVELFEQLLRAIPDDQLRDLFGADAAELARLVPKVHRFVDGMPPSAPREPDQQRRALFSAIADILRRLATRQPLVLLLDDLHWGDEATIALLQHIVPQLTELPVLCLGTYRDVTTDMGPPFERELAIFVRQERTLLLPIRSLTRDAVGELLAACARREPPPDFVDTVFHQTAGNPFFVRELYQHLAEDGHLLNDDGSWKRGLTIDALDVPEGVRLVIGRRLSRLSEPTQRMLTTAALMGRYFELRLVEAMGPVEGDAFLDAVEEAEGAKLVSALRGSRETRYAFAHELIRNTLLSRLSLPRRQRLHARAATVMESVYGAAALPSHAPEMAYHLVEAGPASDEAQAIHYLTLASDQAIATGALESGLANIARALTLVPPNDGRARARLLWKHGLARRNVGQLMEAIGDWETALPLCDPAADTVLIADICQELAHGYAWTGRGMLGVAAAQRGLDVLGPGHVSHRCRLTGSLGWSYALACDFESADPILREALAMAEQLGDVQLVGEALLLNSWHYYLCMRRRDQADACRRAAELLRPANDAGKLGEALVNLHMACIQIGRPGDIAPTEVEARTLAERLGRFDIRVHQLYSETQRDWLVGGDLDALEAGFRRVEEVSGAWRWVAEGSLSQLYLWRGNLAEATKVAQAAISHEPPGTTHTGFGWSMGFLCDCLDGRRAAALDLLERHTGELPRAGRPNTIGAWSALFKVVEGLVALGERARAAALYPLVREGMATGSVVTFDGSHLLETVAGIAAASGGDWSAAESHFARAMELADTMPFVSERAESRYWLAWMQAERGSSGDAASTQELLDVAIAGYRAMGAAWHVRRAEATVFGAPAPLTIR
jgi:eukaryotic-like serine/threonine-protein kinase